MGVSDLSLARGDKNGRVKRQKRELGRETMRYIGIGLAVYFLLTGIYILVLPEVFFRNTPGLSAMGPFNMHFIRDVALTFLVSGGAMLWGALKRNRTALICGAAWPFLHALYHCVIWVHRGLPFDFIWAVDVGAVIIPGFAALFIALRSSGRGKLDT